MPGTGVGPPIEQEPYGDGGARWKAHCPACSSFEYRMVSEDAIPDWIWDRIETYGDPYVCERCNAHWIDPDFPQPIPWERPDPPIE